MDVITSRSKSFNNYKISDKLKIVNAKIKKNRKIKNINFPK